MGDMSFIVSALIVGLVTGALAQRKGYSFLRWMFSMGIIGLLILAFLPYVNRPEATEEDQAAARIRGNNIGLAVSVVGLIVLALRLVQAMGE